MKLPEGVTAEIRADIQEANGTLTAILYYLQDGAWKPTDVAQKLQAGTMVVADAVVTVRIFRNGEAILELTKADASELHNLMQLIDQRNTVKEEADGNEG